MVNVLKLLRNKTRKKMRQQLKGKFTTKPAYTLECKVKWPCRLSVRSPGFHPGKSGSTPGRATKFNYNEKVNFIIGCNVYDEWLLYYI